MRIFAATYQLEILVLALKLTYIAPTASRSKLIQPTQIKNAMFTLKTSIALLLAFLSTLTQAADVSPSSRVLAQFYTALAAGDQAGALASLDPDVTIYESGYVERSRAQYAGHHLPEDIQFAKTSQRRVLQQVEQMLGESGDFAMVTSETETLATLQGKPMRILGTETALLKKSDRGWSIVHLHWSSRKPTAANAAK